jgi:dTDP-4-amino-4,6-dideoxygalactose transaminase
LDSGFTITKDDQKQRAALPVGRPLLDEDDIKAVAEVLRSGWIGPGAHTRAFELAFEKFIGTGAAIAVNSCTAALHLALHVLDLPPGAEVVTSPLTFAATANAIIHAGLVPAFADIDPVTWNLDSDAAAAALTSRSGAVLPVHLYGRPCAIDKFQDLAARRGLHVVYDCAHAIEAEWEGRKVGSYGDACCFSFYANKNITTGDGGMLLTHHPESADRLRTLVMGGISKGAWDRSSESGYVRYEVVEAGFKYNTNDLMAVIGKRQLTKIEAWWKRRQDLWERYMDELADLPLTLPALPDRRTRHAFHLFTPLLKLEESPVTRDELLDAMLKDGVRLGVHYRALHLEPYYSQRFGFRRGAFQNAEFVSDRTFSLPLSPALSGIQIRNVIRVLRQVLGR